MGVTEWVKKNQGVRGLWYRLMNKTPGGLRSVLFVALSLAFWFGIAQAANFALQQVPDSFGGGRGALEDVKMGMTWLWNLLFLSVAVWIAAITVWPAPADPDFTQSPSDDQPAERLRSLITKAGETHLTFREQMAKQMAGLEELVASANKVQSALSSGTERAEKIMERLEKASARKSDLSGDAPSGPDKGMRLDD